MRIVTYPDMNMVHVRVTKEHVDPGNTRTVGEHGTREPCNERPSEPETQESKDPGVRGPRKQTHTGTHANNTHIRTLNTHTDTDMHTSRHRHTRTHMHAHTYAHPWNQQTHGPINQRTYVRAYVHTYVRTRFCQEGRVIRHGSKVKLFGPK